MDFIATIEAALGQKADKEFLPLQPGDVPETHADTSALEAAVGRVPRTRLEDGVRRFVDWYLDYYRVRPDAA